MSRVTEDELKKALSTTVIEKKDAKKRWIERMLKSAKSYHKICPYFDKRLGNCFLRQLSEKKGRCEREGKFDGCPVFMGFLENMYDKLVSEGKNLPIDFMDLSLHIY
ncbi:MAG: hypothetical protein QXH99_07210 [Sulfolobales archaeon]|jgi:hypothetical protein|nr:hypothetical protein [Desulfurococcaceae archaeon]